MVDAVRTQRLLRAVVGTLALAAIVFSATALLLEKGKRCLSRASDALLRAATQARPALEASLADRPCLSARSCGGVSTRPATRKCLRATRRTSSRAPSWSGGSETLSPLPRQSGPRGGAEGKLDGLLTNAAIGTLGGHDLSALVSTNPSRSAGGSDRIRASWPPRRRWRCAAMAWPSSRSGSSASPCPKRTSPRSSSRCAPSGVNSPPSSRPKESAKPAASVPKRSSRRPAFAPRAPKKRRASAANRRHRSRRSMPTLIAPIPDLYRFTRSLDSLDKLVTGNTSLILRTDSEPFSLLQSKDER